MSHVTFWILNIVVTCLIFGAVNSEEYEVRQALVQFMQNLSPENTTRAALNGWNITSDPCSAKWTGVICNNKAFVKKIILESSNLTGVLHATSLCVTKSLTVLSLKGNKISGLLSEDIAVCKDLTHLYLSGNHFYGDLPGSLSHLSNLKRFDISSNNFSGELPDMQRISGLISFLVQDNKLEGRIPEFDFSNLQEFNVSNNLFRGQIPEDVIGHFKSNSFLNDPNLCGEPLAACPPVPIVPKKKPSFEKAVLFSGYVVLGLIVVLFLVYKLVKRLIPSESKRPSLGKKAITSSMPSSTTFSSDNKSGGANQTSEYSLTSVESGTSPPLVVLASPSSMGLTFEQLLRAPAELLGRGKHGSLFKVFLDKGVNLVVKRMKNYGNHKDDFKARMIKIGQVKCHNVLPTVAFYCSMQEKLLVYEFQPNGNLFNLLHGSPGGQMFNWESRLKVADTIAEALALMHRELNEYGIVHGNLKSSNILFNKEMEPCVSEYGIMEAANHEVSSLSPNAEIRNESSSSTSRGSSYGTYNGDVYAFGVILLELLTGKMVQKYGFDLPSWVNSVVKEEWTVEVFDRVLISDGASEEGMVGLLQVALKCINASPTEKPDMSQVSSMIKSINVEEESSVSFDP